MAAAAAAHSDVDRLQRTLSDRATALTQLDTLRADVHTYLLTRLVVVVVDVFTCYYDMLSIFRFVRHLFLRFPMLL